MPKFAANLSMMFAERPFLERFEAAAMAGFRAVECQFPYDHAPVDLAARLERHGLELALFNLPPGEAAKGERGLAALPGRGEEFLRSLDLALEYARVLRCPKLHAMAGAAPAASDRAKATATFIDNLGRGADRAAGAGVTLLIEPLNKRDMPDYFLSTIEQAAEVVRAVGENRIGLQFDIYHAQIAGGDVAERLKSHFRLIRHVQIAGVPGRHEPDIGEINYPYLFGLLDSLGYDGWVGCEYRPKGGTVEGLGWARSHGIVPRPDAA